MRATTVFRNLGPVDAKNVGRDSLLVWIPLLPLLMALALRVGVPWLTAFLRAQWAFELEPYYPLLMSSFVVMAPAVAGMVVGFLLLDERDERVLTALLVTPLPLAHYLLYRLSVPLLLGTLTTLVGYPLAGLVPLKFVDLLAVALLGSLTGPLMALFLAAFAENKVAGFALLKMVNGINMLPIIAFFIPLPWQFLAGLVPTYWPLKVFWLAAADESYFAYAIGGVVVNLVVLRLLLGRFQAVMHRQ